MTYVVQKQTESQYKKTVTYLDTVNFAAVYQEY